MVIVLKIINFMKSKFYKATLFLFLTLNFLISKSWSQNKDSIQTQKKYFIQANELLANNELNAAIYYFHFAQKELPKTNLGKLSIKKIDSLTLIVREKFIKKIQGEWNWLETGTNWRVEETPKSKNINKTLVIKGQNISIYEKAKSDSTLIEFGKIKFVNATPKYPPIVEDFTFLDNLIWTFNFKDDNQTLIMRNTGKIVNTERTLLGCGNIALKFVKKY